MFDDTFPNLEGQIKPAKIGVARFEAFDNAQGVQVVVEGKAVGAHGGVECLFTGVTEGRMANIVRKGQGLDQIHVEIERTGDGAGNLRDFNGVGEPIAKMVGKAAGENLSLIFQAPEGARVDHAVAVALEIIAIGMRGLGMAASAGGNDSERGERELFYDTLRLSHACRLKKKTRQKQRHSPSTGAHSQRRSHLARDDRLSYAANFTGCFPVWRASRA